LGAGFGFLVYHTSLHTTWTSSLVKSLYTFFNSKWFFDFVYNSFIVKPVFLWGHSTSYKILDRGLIEFFGPSGISSLVSKLSSWVSSLHSGYIYHYAFTIFIFATLFLLGEKGYIWDNNLVLLFPFLLMFFFLTDSTSHSAPKKG
jgi:NADH:ubiquinone oxidoreductase subunit 5 (subunit L)/multisubunit Na+/H+ antiporter MnhA subunit